MPHTRRRKLPNTFEAHALWLGMSGLPADSFSRAVRMSTITTALSDSTALSACAAVMSPA